MWVKYVVIQVVRAQASPEVVEEEGVDRAAVLT
jgi:hypothetical protein